MVMLFAIPEELELQGVPYKEASQIAFQNRYFIRALDFPKNARKAAVKFCNLNSDLLCLLVESQNYLTVWLENKEENLEVKKEIYSSKNLLFESTNVSLKSESISDEPVREERKYRSFIYEHLSKHSKKSSKIEPSQLPRDNAILSENASSYQDNLENSILAQDRNSSDNLSSSELPATPQPANKKRPKRKYRGISY
jgi:hypothetical protein